MDDSISVEKLIKNADDLMRLRHYRASVMEAMTALEERANEVIFNSLETKKELTGEMVKWLKKKTKYNFDDKLHPIGEFALGKQISKGERLWNDYKKARDLRNKVSHTAQQISEADAASVIKTVKQWLYFLEGAKDVQASNEDSDLTMEFLSVYAVLISRFRFPKNDSVPSVTVATQNAEKRGDLSTEEAHLTLAAIALRNKLAHQIPIASEELASLIKPLKNLIRDKRGSEIDASQVAEKDQIEKGQPNSQT